MRKLTLNEKITIKGKLDQYGVINLVSLDMQRVLFIYYRITGRSVNDYSINN